MRQVLALLVAGISVLQSGCVTDLRGDTSSVELHENSGSMPIASVLAMCPNIREATQKIYFPKEAAEAGLTEGRVVVTMDLTPSGDLINFRTKASSELFVDAALLGARSLHCEAQRSVQTLRWIIRFKN